MYKVINHFTDLQDSNYPYHVGDTFPRGGIAVNEQRIQELSTSNNKQRKPLIEFVGGSMGSEKEEAQYTKTDINRMSTAELRQLASENGVDGAWDMTGADLKKILIQKLGL